MSFLIVPVIIGLFALINCGSIFASDSKGKDFWLSFMKNYDYSGKLQLFITSEVDTNGNIEISGLSWSSSFSVTADTTTTINIPLTATLDGTGIHNKGIHITAEEDISVYGLNQRQATTDAYLGLPTDVLGLRYYVIGYTPLIRGEFAIVASTNNTTLEYEIPNSLTKQRINLDAGEVFFYNEKVDITGTLIESDKPIAVFSGNECTNIPTGYSACDHIVEQVPPLDTWGKVFTTMPLATRRYGDTFRILSNIDSTDISINGIHVATIDKGKFHEQIIAQPSLIETSEPCLVTQFSNGSNYDGVTSDPFMMVIPPLEQTLSHYTISTPGSAFNINYLNIMAPSSIDTEISLDGVYIDPVRFNPIGDSDFSGAQIPISVGSHTIAAPNIFAIHSYGFASYDSYGYPGGMSFGEINTDIREIRPQNVRISIGDERVYLSWDYNDSVYQTGDDLFFRIKMSKNDDEFDYIRNTDNSIIEFNQLEAVIPTPASASSSGVYHYKVIAVYNGTEYETDEIRDAAAGLLAVNAPAGHNIIRHSPILFIPGTGGGKWDDMKSHLNDFGLVQGGELELTTNDNNELIAIWKNEKIGDFYTCNYNKTLHTNGVNIIFHPCGPIGKNYLPTKLFVDKIRELEKRELGEDRKLTLVGQSLGGLRARVYAQKIFRDSGDENVLEKVERLITVGTPNDGVLIDHKDYQSDDVYGAWRTMLGNAPEDTDDFWEDPKVICVCEPTLADNTNYWFSGGYINEPERFGIDAMNCRWDACDMQNKIRGMMEYLRDGILGFAGGWDYSRKALMEDVLADSNFLIDLNEKETSSSYTEEYGAFPSELIVKSLVYVNPGDVNISPWYNPLFGAVKTSFLNKFMFNSDAYQSLNLGTGPDAPDISGDGFIHWRSQSLKKTFFLPSSDVVRQGYSHLSELKDYNGLFQALETVKILTITAKCPVNIEVEAPSGKKQSGTHAGILGAVYKEIDVDFNGSLDKIIEIPYPEQGGYKITVSPLDNADPNETFTLEMEKDGITTIIVENRPISDIVNTPMVTNLFINATPTANAGIDQAIEADNTGYALASLDGSGSFDSGSTPDTNDDIVAFQWLEEGNLLAEGEIVQTPLNAGEHKITLRVTDKNGAIDEDTVSILVTEQERIEGDLDGDGTIGPADYNLFIGSFGKCEGQVGYLEEANYDTDTCVTFVDYQIWYGYYMNQ